MNRIAMNAIDNIKKEILILQVAIAEELENGSRFAEATRLAKIAELRADLEFVKSNAHQSDEWWNAA